MSDKSNDEKKAPQDPLDLIQMVQQARRMQDEQTRPSQMHAAYWIEAWPRQRVKPTPRSGEWLIETDLAAVDALWLRVREATEAGQLGIKSKVSCASPDPQQPDKRLICVRTYDADDEADLGRVQAALQALAITPLRYQRDQPA